MVVNTNLARTFAALGDSTRLQILTQLENGPKTCSDLVSMFDLTQQAVSKHIGVLNKAGLLTQTKNGRSRICKIVPNALRDVSRWIEEKTIATSLPLIGYGSVVITRQNGILRVHESKPTTQSVRH